jgi:hypothetical protein
LKRTPIVQVIRARIDKWDCISLNNFFRGKKQNYFLVFISHGINIQNIYGSQKLNSKRQIIQLKMCK